MIRVENTYIYENNNLMEVTYMFWIGALCVMVIVATALVSVADLLDREEMEDEYEIAYIIV